MAMGVSLSPEEAARKMLQMDEANQNSRGALTRVIAQVDALKPTWKGVWAARYIKESLDLEQQIHLINNRIDNMVTTGKIHVNEKAAGDDGLASSTS